MKTRSSTCAAREAEIDKIVDRKLDDNGSHLYRVRWKGFGTADDSWRSPNDLENGAPAIAEYEQRTLGGKGRRRGKGKGKGKGKRANMEADSQKELSGDKKGTVVNNSTDADAIHQEGGSRRKMAKVTHFADNVEKLEQKIVGGDWQKVVESLKE